MVPLWFFFDCSIVLRTSIFLKVPFRGFHAFYSWSFHGYSMVFLWLFYDCSIDFSVFF